LWVKRLNAKNIRKEIFTVKRFQLDGKSFADDENVETEVRKLLRQQSNLFYAAGSDALVKRWDRCISVGGGYVPVWNITCFMFYINL
jgi:hypothetical protein